MKLNELIENLQYLSDKFGDTDVYIWNDSKMCHVPLNSVKYPLADDFVEGLKDDKDYIEDFNMILESVVLN